MVDHTAANRPETALATALEQLRRCGLASAELGVGEVPPAPPTLRGKLGALALALVKPFFGWYTHGLRSYLQAARARDAHVASALQAVVVCLEDLRRTDLELREAGRELRESDGARWSSLEETQRAIGALQQAAGEMKASVGSLEAAGEARRVLEDELRHRVAAAERGLALSCVDLDRLRARAAELAAAQAQADSTLERQTAELTRMAPGMGQTNRAVGELEARMQRIEEELDALRRDLVRARAESVRRSEAAEIRGEIAALERRLKASG